jgi:hypothetical protein
MWRKCLVFGGVVEISSATRSAIPPRRSQPLVSANAYLKLSSQQVQGTQGDESLRR